MNSINEIPNYVISTTPTSSFANSSIFGGRGPPTVLASTGANNFSNSTSEQAATAETDDDPFSLLLFVLKVSIMVGVINGLHLLARPGLARWLNKIKTFFFSLFCPANDYDSCDIR